MKPSERLEWSWFQKHNDTLKKKMSPDLARSLNQLYGLRKSIKTEFKILDSIAKLFL